MQSLIYPVCQRHLVVFELLFLWTSTQMLEGRDEHTHTVLTLWFRIGHKQTLAKGAVDYHVGEQLVTLNL